jgi:hypothetical protein
MIAPESIAEILGLGASARRAGIKPAIKALTTRSSFVMKNGVVLRQ